MNCFNEMTTREVSSPLKLRKNLQFSLIIYQWFLDVRVLQDGGLFKWHQRVSSPHRAFLPGQCSSLSYQKSGPLIQGFYSTSGKDAEPLREWWTNWKEENCQWRVIEKLGRSMLEANRFLESIGTWKRCPKKCSNKIFRFLIVNQINVRFKNYFKSYRGSNMWKESLLPLHLFFCCSLI